MITDIEPSNPYSSPIEPENDDAQIKQGRRTGFPPARILRSFQLLSAYAFAMGLVCIPIGLFVGPHLLVAAFGHLLVGVSAVGVNYGLRRAASWGWWAGVVLSSTIAIISGAAVLQSWFFIGDVTAGVFFSISGLLFTALLVDLIGSRPQV